MGLLFPLFLLAGLAILIPIIIHLVNLRRYKKEIFPNLRFLRNMQLLSKRSSTLRRRWLLLTRILFILALVVAFAHPFIKGKKGANGQNISGISIIYLDNSYSMSAQKDGQPLLSFAKNAARKLLASGTAKSHYIVLSNDNLYASFPVDRKEALAKIDAIGYSAQTVSLNNILASITTQTTFKNQKNKLKSVYLFSDFQAATFLSAKSFADSFPKINFYLYPLVAGQTENYYIDSAWMPYETETGKMPAALLVRIGRQHEGAKAQTNLRLLVNGQTRLVKTVQFPSNKKIVTDTLAFPVQKKGWTKSKLILSDAPVDFDDTFRLASKSPSSLSVLMVSGKRNVIHFFRSAFNIMPQLQQQVVAPDALAKMDLKKYSLIVLWDGAGIDVAATEKLKKALARGVNILVFPGLEQANNSLNALLENLAGISFEGADTISKQVVVLQKKQPLIADLFTSVPENVQLPYAQVHFTLSAPLSSNQQDIMNFSDGSPLLTSFHFAAGKLFLCTAPLNDENTNFPMSYFFAPMLYKMSLPAGSSRQFTGVIGSRQPLWIPNNLQAANRELWHLYRKHQDWVPLQKVADKGLGIYLAKMVTAPGFYLLKQPGNAKDSIWIGMNNNAKESRLAAASKTAIENALPGSSFWLSPEKVDRKGWNSTGAPSFPLWKCCMLIALLCLLAETIFILRPPIKTAYFKESGQGY